MSFPSTVLVYEFFTGGGCDLGEPPDGLACEALAMLWAVLADFRRWGSMRTLTALDPRFEERIPGLNRSTLPADEVLCLPDTRHELFRSLLKRCDAVLIIAPERGEILAKLTAEAETARIPVLGSNASAVTTAGNKAACHRLFRKAKLPTPRTYEVGFAAAPLLAKQMGYPLIVKPVDGVGAEGVYEIERPCDLAEALDSVRQCTSREKILLQSYTAGTHASVSLIVEGNRCLPLSLNRQLIQTGSPFKYLGSQVPLAHPSGEFAVELACSAVKLLPGLRGYVGVDMVLTEDSAQLIEVNPRLTTSYIGLRRLTPVNLAQVIWEACMKGILPDQVALTGRVTIKKDDPSSWGLSVGNL